MEQAARGSGGITIPVDLHLIIYFNDGLGTAKFAVELNLRGLDCSKVHDIILHIYAISLQLLNTQIERILLCTSVIFLSSASKCRPLGVIYFR